MRTSVLADRGAPLFVTVPPPPPGMGGASVRLSSVRRRCAFLRASLIKLIGSWNGQTSQSTLGLKSTREIDHVLYRAPRIPVVHLVGFADKGRQKGLVAEIIDDARN